MSRRSRPVRRENALRARPFLEQTRLGVLSKERWGIGSALVIGSLLVLGLTLLARSLPRGSLGTALIGAVMLSGGILLLVVRASEEVRIDRRRRGRVLGETGVVLRRVGPVPGGVVKVRGELWSAEGEPPMEVGESVRVVGVHGLHVRVEKAPDTPEPFLGSGPPTHD